MGAADENDGTSDEDFEADDPEVECELSPENSDSDVSEGMFQDYG